MTGNSPNPPPHSTSLRWRLMLINVVIVLVLLATLGAFQYVTLRQSLLSQRETALSATVASAGAQPVQDPSDPNRLVATSALLCRPLTTTVSAYISSFATGLSIANGSGVSVAIYNASRQFVASAPVGAAPPADLSLLSRTSRTPRSNILSTPLPQHLVEAVPITNRGHTLCGYALMSTPVTAINTTVARFLRYLIIGAVVAAFLAGVLAFATLSQALRPLAKLHSTARALSHGDLSARSGLPSRRDEIGLLAMSFDSMAERIERQFVQKSKAEDYMRRFMADASHELRTPLTSLKGYIDVMRRGAGRDTASLDVVLEHMSSDADRMRRLLNDLLLLARTDAPTPDGGASRDLCGVIEEVTSHPHPEAPSDLELILPDNAHVSLPHDALVAIATNLWNNACAYAPHARQKWEVSIEDSVTRLTMHDDGPGIDATDLPHLFERFYRGAHHRAREEGGSGLGLAIVHSLVTRYGGSISVISPTGEGTTFVVTLPTALAPGATAE